MQALEVLLCLQNFHFLIYFMVFVVGVLVGLEIPLVMRLLKKNVALKDLVSEVLTYDYLGALAVSLAFPLFLVPQLGLIRTGLVFGLMRGALIVVVMATLAALTPIPQSVAWQKAITRPAIDMATGLIKGWLPADWAKQLGDAMPKVTPTITPKLTIGI